MAVANRKIWMSGMTFRVERSARTACSVCVKQNRNEIWPMRRALKQANPSPHRLRRHISRFKKSTLQNAVHNDDAGSQ